MITKEEFVQAVIDEDLERYCTIKYNDTQFTIENCLFFNKNGEKYTVTSSGERGTHNTKQFDNEQQAYAYMLEKLRGKKHFALRNLAKGYFY